MSSTALSINLNKVALLRNSRDTNFPDPTEFGRLCIEYGCQGITVHPRPDMRHIRPEDVTSLSKLVSAHSNIEYNIEGNPFAGPEGAYPGFIELVMRTKPNQVTLVPDTDDQLTSDHGFDIKLSGERLAPLITKFQAAGIRVSLFMDPDLEQIELAKQIGADRIELYTGPYAHAHLNHSPEFKNLHDRFESATLFAQTIGLGVNAGHDLNLDNLAHFLKIEGILEVSIGHAFTVDSLLMGMGHAIAAYLHMMDANNAGL